MWLLCDHVVITRLQILLHVRRIRWCYAGFATIVAKATEEFVAWKIPWSCITENVVICCPFRWYIDVILQLKLQKLLQKLLIFCNFCNRVWLRGVLINHMSPPQHTCLSAHPTTIIIKSRINNNKNAESNRKQPREGPWQRSGTRRECRQSSVWSCVSSSCQICITLGVIKNE